MDILYLIFIKPIEILLGSLFNAYISLTGNFGISVVMLSLSVSILMFPLFYIAEVWKKKEQAVENRMKRRLTSIKKHYTGQKRYCLIKATHRIEGYTALNSLRTSFGLLIQIPFFFAAYHLLSHYEAFQGHGWLFINDFSEPDRLISGINMLPLLMTAVNIVSSSIYMKGSRFREMVEMYVMAGVFLVLLYNSPSALVLYWTMNNVFSIGKSLIFLRLFPREKYVPDEDEKGLKDYLCSLKNTFRSCLTADMISFFAVVVFFGFQCRVLKFHKSSFVHLYLLTAGLVFICALIFFVVWFRRFRRKEEKFMPLIKIVAAGFVFVAVSAAGFWFQLQDADGGLLKKLVFSASICADFVLFLIIKYFLESRSLFRDVSTTVKQKDCSSVFLWNILLVGIAVTSVWPLLVFFSAPEETGISLFTVLESNIPVLAVWIAVVLLIYRFSGKKQQVWLAEIAVLISILTFLYHYVLPCDYGELDKTMLSLDSRLDNSSFFIWLGDIAVIAVSCIFARLFVRKYPLYCRSAVMLLCCCMIGMVCIKAVKYAGSNTENRSGITEKAHLPDNNDIVNGYSRNGKNVVLFLSDMFTGGYMVDVLKEHPEYKEALSGFTWYKNSLAPSYKTSGSMASIMAGEEFLPLELNKMPGSGREKLRKAAEIMVDRFKERDYSVSIIGGESAYLNLKDFRDVDYAYRYPYGEYWKQKYRSGEKEVRLIDQGHLFMMLGLFQNAPYFLKPIIYNDSGWFVFSRKALFWTVEDHVYPNYGFMQLLPEISNAESKGNTFKYIHNSLTHGPYGVNENGEVIRPGEQPDENSEGFYSGKSPYYSTVAFVDLFIEWLDWLKEEGIYDNTYIILVSDHGTNRPELNPMTDSKLVNRLNSIMMIKPFDSEGDLVTDENTLVISSDAPEFMKNALDGSPVEFAADRSLPVVRFDSTNFLDTGIIEIIDAFEVTGDMFDPKNWKEIK